MARFSLAAFLVPLVSQTSHRTSPFIVPSRFGESPAYQHQGQRLGGLMVTNNADTESLVGADIGDESVNSTAQTTALEEGNEATEVISAVVASEEAGLLQKIVQGMPPDAVLWLNAVAVIWGSQHPVIKMVVEDSNASAFSLVRFALGALIASPPWWTSKNDEENDPPSNPARTWRWGAEMGFWMFLGYAFQAIGLQYTTAQRSGFLLYLNVKFVPFFAFLLLGRRISIPTWLSALTALAGTSLLAYDGTTWDLNVGDLWSIAAAAASAMFILRLEKASVAVPNSVALNASCLWVVSAAALVWTVVDGGTTSTTSVWSAGVGSLEGIYQEIVHIVRDHPLELVYLSGVTTALANYIQTRAQQKVTAERASIIYAMDPVYGAIWSNVLLGETLTTLGMVGAGLITLAAATNAFLDLGANENDTPKSE